MRKKLSEPIAVLAYSPRSKEKGKKDEVHYFSDTYIMKHFVVKLRGK